MVKVSGTPFYIWLEAEAVPEGLTLEETQDLSGLV